MGPQHGLGAAAGARGVAGAAGRGRGAREDGVQGAGGRLSRRASDPAAEAERRAAQDRMFALDLDRVLSSARPAAWPGQIGFWGCGGVRARLLALARRYAAGRFDRVRVRGSEGLSKRLSCAS